MPVPELPSGADTNMCSWYAVRKFSDFMRWG
jgi:hypothetical protein